jgi:hypothetical protein
VKIREVGTLVPKGDGESPPSRMERLWFLIRIQGALVAIVVPFVAFMIGRAAVHGHAKPSYFEEVAGILPVLLLALVVEQRYLNRRSFPSGPTSLLRESRGTNTVVILMSKVYAVLLVIYLALGEFAALQATARGFESGSELKTTAGALAAGFTALIVTGLVGPGGRDSRAA